MGTLWWKTIRRKPFTSTELHQSADLLLKQPPLPADWRNAAIDVRARDGTTLLDTWRAHFTSELKAIATKETWTLQKAACVSFVFMENSWRTTTIVAHKAKSPSSWKHILGDNKLFEGAEGQNLLALLTQRYLMAILSATCLTTIAHRLYSLNDQEMRVVSQFEFGSLSPVKPATIHPSANIAA